MLVLITAAFLTPLFTQLPEAGARRDRDRGGPRIPAGGPDAGVLAPGPRSFAIAATALIGVLVFDLLPGLMIAVVLSLVLFIARASAPELVILGRAPDGRYEHAAANPGVTLTPGVLIVRPNGGLFFGNVDRVRKEVMALVSPAGQEPIRWVLLVLSASFELGLPVLDSLTLLEQQLRGDGISLCICEVPSSAWPQLERNELYILLGPSRVVRTVDAALAAARDQPAE